MKIILLKQMHHIGLKGEGSFADWLMGDRDWIFENESFNKDYILPLFEKTYDFTDHGDGKEEKVIFFPLKGKKIIESVSPSRYVIMP